MRTCCNWKPQLATREKGFAEQNWAHCWPDPGHFGRLQTLKFSDSTGSVYTCAKSLQSCPTLCDAVDCSPPGFSVPGILQARTLEWVAMPFSRRIFLTQGSNPHFLCLWHCRRILPHWALGKPGTGSLLPKPQTGWPHSLDSGPQSLSHSPACAYGDWPHCWPVLTSSLTVSSLDQKIWDGVT